MEKVKVLCRYQRFFLILAVLFFAFFARQGHAGSNISHEDRKRLSELVAEEFLSVKEDLNFIEKNKNAAWAEGDRGFYDFWLKGLEKEREGNIADAIALYEKALETERYEMSTYEVLLSLGRAYFLTGEKDKALSALQEFIKNAEQDLSEPGPWGFTPEGEQIMRKKIVHARWLITLCK